MLLLFCDNYPETGGNQALSTAAETAKTLTGLDLRNSLVWEIRSEAQSRDTKIKAAYEEEYLRTVAELDRVLESSAFIENPFGKKPGSGTMPADRYSMPADRYSGVKEFPPSTVDISSRWLDTLSLHDRFSSPTPITPRAGAPFPSLSGEVFAPAPKKVQFEFAKGVPPPPVAELEFLRDLASHIGGGGFAIVTAGLDPHSYDRAFWLSDYPLVNEPKVEAVGFSSSTHEENERGRDETSVSTDPETGTTVATRRSTQESTVTTGFTDAFTSSDGVTVVTSNRVTSTLVTNLVRLIILNRPTAKDSQDPTAKQPLSNLRADQITWSQLFALLVLLVTLAGEKAWEFLSRPEFEEPSLRM